MADITDLLAAGFSHLEKKYGIEFDDIDSWDESEAYEQVSDLLEENPDDSILEDLMNNLESISVEDFVLAVEKFAEM